jgi:hypothetical protein
MSKSTTVLDAIFSGPRKFEILLTQCEDFSCGCQCNYCNLYFSNVIKEEFKQDYYKRKFIPILYCHVLEKPRKASSSVEPLDSTETLHGTESHRVVFKPCCTKDKQRFLEKAWITIHFGQDLFKWSHPHRKTFSLEKFCEIVQNGDLLNHLKCDFFNDDCLKSLNQQICNYFR